MSRYKKIIVQAPVVETLHSAIQRLNNRGLMFKNN